MCLKTVTQRLEETNSPPMIKSARKLSIRGHKVNSRHSCKYVFKKIDCIRIHVPDLEQALEFYRDRLGLELVWRNGVDEAGLSMIESDSEIVLVKEELEHPELDLMVESVQNSIRLFRESGGKVIVDPFEIRIGKCSVIEDPWGNRFVILDRSKGLLKVDKNRNVI